MISTLNRYRFRSAFRDAGRALTLKPKQIDELLKDPDANRDGPVYQLSERIIAVPRHLGIHCGGIVITPRPVSQLAPLERANKGVIVTQYDKDAAEAMGLIKIDLLGNRSLSTVNEAVEIIGRPRQRERKMRRFKSMRHVQRFLSAHGPINNLFRLCRHGLKARHYRTFRDRSFATWREVTYVTSAA